MAGITAIVARSYSYGRTWLQLNYKRLNLDPQLCRIITKAESLRGFSELRIVYVRGWRGAHEALRIAEIIRDRKAAGKITEEIFE